MLYETARKSSLRKLSLFPDFHLPVKHVIVGATAAILAQEVPLGMKITLHGAGSTG